MNRSVDHVLVSHVGRLPEPPALRDALKDGPISNERLSTLLPEAVREVVQAQLKAGVDVVNDGELGKTGEWAGYMVGRMSGLEVREVYSDPPIGREQLAFPEYSVGRMGGPIAPGSPPRTQVFCTGPAEYVGLENIRRDIANLQAAVSAENGHADAFMAAVSPDNIAADEGSNEYYDNDDEFLEAKANALRTEYAEIIDAGFILQLDMPVFKYNGMSLTVEEFRGRWKRVVEVLNSALSGFPREQIRVHVCYGSGILAHTGDIALSQIIDIALSIHASALSFDQNVRHEHEWQLFQDLKLPDGHILMPGVVSHFTEVVEHPELVAQRIMRLADLVGKENIIAGSDCGLGRRIHAELVWAKLASAGEGARIASSRLWK